MLFELLQAFVADHRLLVRADRLDRTYLPSGIFCPPFVESKLQATIRRGYPGLPLYPREIKMYWSEDKFLIRVLYRKGEAVGAQYGTALVDLEYVDIKVSRTGYEEMWIVTQIADLYEASPYYIEDRAKAHC